MNFYLNKIQSYKPSLYKHLQLIRSPLENVALLVNDSKKVDIETLKKEIFYFFLNEIIYMENFSLNELSQIIEKKFKRKFNKILKNNDDFKNFVDLTHYLFDRIELKKEKELDDVLEGKIVFWAPRDDHLRIFKDKRMVLLRNFN